MFETTTLERNRSRMMRWRFVCVMLSVVSLLSARNSSRLGRVSAAPITADPRVRQALAKVVAASANLTEEQIRITEIPAPPFHETTRGAYLARRMSDAGLKVHTDEVGNVIGERTGASSTRTSPCGRRRRIACC